MGFDWFSTMLKLSKANLDWLFALIMYRKQKVLPTNCICWNDKYLFMNRENNWDYHKFSWGAGKVAGSSWICDQDLYFQSGKWNLLIGLRIKFIFLDGKYDPKYDFNIPTKNVPAFVFHRTRLVFAHLQALLVTCQQPLPVCSFLFLFCILPLPAVTSKLDVLRGLMGLVCKTKKRRTILEEICPFYICNPATKYNFV